MVQFGKKKTITDYLYSRPVVILLGIIAIWLSVSVFERYTVERDMAERRQDAETERQELIERKEQVEKKVQYLSGDRGIEEEIRKHFDVAKEGEQVVILLGQDELENEAQIQTEPPKRWYQFWR